MPTATHEKLLIDLAAPGKRLVWEGTPSGPRTLFSELGYLVAYFVALMLFFGTYAFGDAHLRSREVLDPAIVQQGGILGLVTSRITPRGALALAFVASLGGTTLALIVFDHRRLARTRYLIFEDRALIVEGRKMTRFLLPPERECSASKALGGSVALGPLPRDEITAGGRVVARPDAELVLRGLGERVHEVVWALGARSSDTPSATP